MRAVVFLVAAVAVVATGCTRDRRYQLHGQVLAVNPAGREITLKHDAIPGVMPGMTMPFKVRDGELLRGREPGDLVTATLIVEESDAYLSAIRKTGHAALTEEPPPPLPTILQPGDLLPDATLMDHGGRTRRLSEWRGQTLAVTFMYTRCPMPEFCPLMDRRFADVQRALAADASLAGVHLLSVSFDTAYDTPAVLKAHADRVGARPAHWTFATGERGEIERLASSLGVAISRPGAGAEAEIVHNLRTAVVAGDGRIVTILSGNEWTSEQLLHHLRSARR